MQIPPDLTHQSFFDNMIKGLVVVGQYDLLWDTPTARQGVGNLYDLMDKKLLFTEQDPIELRLELVRIRNTCSPGNIGAFDNFRWELVNRSATLVEIEDMLGNSRHYSFMINPYNARRDLQEISPEFVLFLDNAIRTFRPDIEKSLQNELTPKTHTGEISSSLSR